MSRRLMWKLGVVLLLCAAGIGVYVLAFSRRERWATVEVPPPQNGDPAAVPALDKLFRSCRPGGEVTARLVFPSADRGMEIYCDDIDVQAGFVAFQSCVGEIRLLPGNRAMALLEGHKRCFQGTFSSSPRIGILFVPAAHSDDKMATVSISLGRLAEPREEEFCTQCLSIGPRRTLLDVRFSPDFRGRIGAWKCAMTP